VCVCVCVFVVTGLHSCPLSTIRLPFFIEAKSFLFPNQDKMNSFALLLSVFLLHSAAMVNSQASNCTGYSDCSSCTAAPGCGWGDGISCYPGTSTGPSSPSITTDNWIWMSNGSTRCCSTALTCRTCLTNSGCGWDGVRCIAGSATGPYSETASSWTTRNTGCICGSNNNYTSCVAAGCFWDGASCKLGPSGDPLNETEFPQLFGTTSDPCPTCQCNLLSELLAGSSVPMNSSDCCLWERVGCENGQVVSLSLNYSSLSGTIPETLCERMPFLRHLDISWNSISGSLPASLHDCHALEFFDATSNRLTGTLPESWANLTNLRTLLLWGNRLSGTIPSHWSSMRKLERLDLSWNSLSGPLPTSFHECQALEFFRCPGNPLTGTLPESWANLTNMKVLVIYNTHVSGTLPSGWSSMTKLELLDLEVNQLSGTLPPSWGSFRALTELYLNSNTLSGTLPAAWSTMESLGLLWLYRNKLEGTLPAEWTKLSVLEVLQISNNDLSGSLPEAWGNMSLKQLHLQNNRFSGTLPSRWGEMASLEVLWLSKNQIWGDIPSDWGAMRLSELRLSANKLNGSLPDALSNVSSMRTLDLTYNALASTLPASWANLGAVTIIALSGNMLHGSIPASWSAMASLTSLYLDDNDFAGPVPHEPCTFPSLTELWLLNNQYSGSLPECYNNRSSRLRTLLLDYNQVNWIPSLSLSNIEVLSLSYNPVGLIPNSSSLPQSIKALYVTGVEAAEVPRNFSSMPLELPDFCILMAGGNKFTLNTSSEPLNHFLDHMSVLDLSGNILISGFEQAILPPVSQSPTRSSGCPRNLQWASFIDVASTSPKFSGIAVSNATGLNLISPWEISRQFPEKVLTEVYTQDFAWMSDVPCSVLCAPNQLTVGQIVYDPNATAITRTPYQLTLTEDRYFIDRPLVDCHCGAINRETLLGSLSAIAMFNITPTVNAAWEGIVSRIRPSPSGFFTHDSLPAPLLFDVPYTLTVTVQLFGPTKPPQFASFEELQFTTPAFMRIQCPSAIQAAIPNTTVCYACPSECSCNGTSVVVTTEEFWRPSVMQMTLLPCEMQGCRAASPRQGWECAEGYEGPLCGGCAPNFQRLDDRCIPCIDDAVGGAFAVIGFMLLLVLYVTVMVLLEIRIEADSNSSSDKDDDEEEKGKSKIARLARALKARLLASPLGRKVQEMKEHISVVKVEVLNMIKMLGNHLTILSYVLQSRALEAMLSTAAWVSESASAPAQVTKADQLRVYLMCAAGLDPLELLYSILPLFLILFIAVFIILTVMSRFPATGVPRPGKSWRSIATIMLLLFADSLLDMSTAPFSCDTLVFENALGGTTEFYTMREDRSLRCEGSAYIGSLVLASVLVVIATIGVPAFCMFLYFRLRRRKGQERAMAAFAFMCGNYRTETWFWELIILVRKNLCVVVIVAVEDPIAQLVGLHFILVFFLVAQQRVKPYNCAEYNRNDTLSLINAIVLMDVIAMFLRYNVTAHTIGVVFAAVVCVIGVIPFPLVMVRRIRREIRETVLLREAPLSDDPTRVTVGKSEQSVSLPLPPPSSEQEMALLSGTSETD
jgi:Leucine-rich repeat (LRR) protein